MNYINPNAPAAGLTRLLNMRDNNPATQLAYVPTKDIAAMGSMGGLEFNSYSGIPQARGIAAVADGGSIQDAPLAPVADELASRGRYGDSMLLHVRPDELQGLASLGTLTINPDTGLPEAFSFKSLLPAIGAIGGSFLLGPAFGMLVGKGALATGLAAGVGGFAGGLAAGQGVGQAALGGLMSGATAGFFSGAPAGIDPITGGAGGSTLTDIGGQGFIEGASQQAIQTTLPTTTANVAASTAASSAVAPSVKQAAINYGGGMAGQVPTPLTQQATLTPQVPILDTTPTATAGAARIPTPEFSVDQMTASQLEKYPAGFATENKFATIDPKTYEAPSKFRQATGAKDFTGREYITRQEYIDVGGRPTDMKPGEFLEATFKDPMTYVGAGLTTLMQPPEYEELDIQEPTLGPSYVPRERTLAGGVQSPARSSEEYLRMALEGGYQPLSEQYRYAAQGGLVGLEEGGQPSSLTAMSITPESERIRTDMSAAPSQEDRASRVFNDLESRGGVSALMSLVLRNNPQAIQFINQNASSPRNLQLNEMGAGRHSYFDTADTGLYPKAAGGLVRLVEGGTPEQGVLQSQLSPVLQQQQQTPLLQQQEQQISERARQDELLQRDQAMSRGQQFIEQPTGNQQLFQQMQAAGQVIGQQLAQGPQAYATPPGQSAAPSSFVSGTNFGFNTGGLVGLREGGDIPQEESIEPYVSFLKEKEKFKAKPYIPTKGDKPTIGYGHTENVKMTDKEITEEQADLLLRRDIRKRLPKIKNKIKDFDSFPQSLKTAMVGEWFRGSLSGSPKTIKLINAGEYEKASKEFLNNEEYRKAEERKRSGIKPRMELVSNELKKLSVPTTKDMYDDKPFSSVYSGMPIVQKETQMAKLSDTEKDAGILSILRNILSGDDKQYEVQAGDTLSAIAKQQGMSLDELLEANKSISDPNVISRGQEITVPDQSSFLDRVRGALGYAQGGEVGKYFEGQVVGNGDGMSDQILFEVEGNNPDKALLSRDEYVIPADVVAMLGNGSSNAGSEQLDSFIKGIRQDSFGTEKQQRQLNAQQDLRGLV
jgi:lysozyme